MDSNRYISFIERIIQQTKEKKLNWKYLDREKGVYQNMGWVRERTALETALGTGGRNIPDFNTEDSFCVKIDNTYIVLYVLNNQPAQLYIIPNTYKKIILLTPESFGDYITRLLNLVQSQFPSAEAFIDSILDGQD